MIHAFGVTVGVLLGALFALGCVAFIVWAAVTLTDRWLARQATAGHARWNEDFPLDLFDPSLPSCAPSPAEIESWWIPMDHWDQRR